MTKLAKCGTYAAARRHERRGEQLDEACATARREYWAGVKRLARADTRPAACAVITPGVNIAAADPWRAYSAQEGGLPVIESGSWFDVCPVTDPRHRLTGRRRWVKLVRDRRPTLQQVADRLLWPDPPTGGLFCVSGLPGLAGRVDDLLALHAADRQRVLQALSAARLPRWVREMMLPGADVDLYGAATDTFAVPHVDTLMWEQDSGWPVAADDEPVDGWLRRCVREQAERECLVHDGDRPAATLQVSTTPVEGWTEQVEAQVPPAGWAWDPHHDGWIVPARRRVHAPAETPIPDADGWEPPTESELAHNHFGLAPAGVTEDDVVDDMSALTHTTQTVTVLSPTAAGVEVFVGVGGAAKSLGVFRDLRVAFAHVDAQRAHVDTRLAWLPRPGRWIVCAGAPGWAATADAPRLEDNAALRQALCLAPELVAAAAGRQTLAVG